MAQIGVAGIEDAAVEHNVFWLGGDCQTTTWEFELGFDYKMGTLLTIDGSTESGDGSAVVGAVVVHPAVDGEQVAGIAAYDDDLTLAGANKTNSVYIKGIYNYDLLDIPATWTESQSVTKALFLLLGIDLDVPKFSAP